MIFGPHHYVPVLKVKRAEKAALQSIAPEIQHRLTPLLEIVERKPDKSPTIAAHLDTAFKSLAESVAPYSRCFIDTRELESEGEAAALAVFDRATAAGIAFTPVTGVERSTDTNAALSNRANGIALRSSRAELEKGGLAARIQGFLSQHGLVQGDVDLIVDLGPVHDFITEGVNALTDAFLLDVPSHHLWRTLTVSACGFPPSMSVVERNSNALVERVDWTGWRNGLHSSRSSLARLPTFSDCAIQHTMGVEDYDPRTMPTSAAIRYASTDRWLLIKGESTRVTRPSIQFPALAEQLVYGHLQSHFAGENHCGGCASMKACADGAGGFGSLEAWRRLGTIHHITTVLEQLAALPWP